MSLLGPRDIKGYCVKCREMVDMTGCEEAVMKNKKKAWKGSCTQCGKTLFKIKAESREGMW
jgi:hypothetical protein